MAALTGTSAIIASAGLAQAQELEEIVVTGQ